MEGPVKLFDRTIRVCGLTRYRFLVTMEVEFGGEQPGWAQNDVRDTLMDELESRLGIRPHTVKVGDVPRYPGRTH